MSKNFSTIKKKYLIASVIASAALGACCGIIVACLLAVIFKTCGVGFHWAIYIPIALVIAAGTGVLLFLLLRPTDLSMAKKLDRDYALSQKAQTMVEFRETEGEMFALQREQADEALSSVAQKRVDWSFILKFLAIPVLAVSLLLAGVFVPAKKSTAPEAPSFSMTDSQKTALINLINDVKASSLKTNIKEPTVEVLNGLLAGLEDEQPQSVMRTAVRSSVKIIDGFVSVANTYSKIGSALATSEGLKTFSYAIMDGATFYIEMGKTIKTLAQVNAKAENADENIEKILLNFASNVLQNYTINNGDEDEEESQSETMPLPMAEASEKLAAYAALLREKLEESGVGPAEGEDADVEVDELYAILSRFADRLKICANATSGMNDSTYYSTISLAFTDFASVKEGAVPPLATQAYNCMMDEFIRNRLAEIFRLSVSEFGESPVVTTPSRGDDSEGDESQSGGAGKGGTSTAGNDLVLNTEFDDGSQIKYGEVIKRYEQFFNELVDGGNCPDELAAYIRRYFDLLYNNKTNDET